MNPKQFRLGNYIFVPDVSNKNTAHKIYAINANYITTLPAHKKYNNESEFIKTPVAYIEPIPLTRECVEIAIVELLPIINKSGIYIKTNEDRSLFEMVFVVGNEMETTNLKINYVHELQNLFYILNKKEIEFNFKRQQL